MSEIFVKNSLRFLLMLMATFILLGYVYYFTGLPKNLGLIKIPQINIEHIEYFRGETDEISILFSSSIPLDHFNDASYLRLLGQTDSSALSYMDYFNGSDLKESVIIDSPEIQLWDINAERYVYKGLVSCKNHTYRGKVYMRLFFVKHIGYIYGTNQIVLSL